MLHRLRVNWFGNETFGSVAIYRIQNRPNRPAVFLGMPTR
jgi:hypothetical protein